MSRTKIPLLKNKGLVLKPQRTASALRRLAWILLAVGIMMFYVWLKLATNASLIRIANLERQIEEQTIENERLQAEVTTLSSFETIQKAAHAMGFDFVPQENITRISAAH